MFTETSGKVHNHWNHPSKVQQNTFLNVNTLQIFQILSEIANLSNIREQARKPRSNANPPSDSAVQSVEVLALLIETFLPLRVLYMMPLQTKKEKF